ncbi:MAG: MMPL family transporter [Gammaproteobacteria bacterium]|jgi:predicted RND superfamily exporter protein|nr:MMPL family transporter [Gammaproteobacteria bacterium]MBP6053768.1 MMPL family transporter [Pseudomonadales bacterium]MBK6584845.1 MMPL family transporter [Gammaproteobacteria bacterium]MBK7170020.1 MMPL family transporter [Gammaproteobacteria bacterium]MBK7519646.1 MMPL family transporter [Gammaproteobacteria bacterium]
MRNRLLNAYQRLLLSRPWLSLGVIALLIVLFAVRIPELRLEASADTLVLEGDKALEFYREIGKRFGSQSFLVITYRPLHEDLMSDAVLGRIAALRAELQQLENVRAVTSILDVPLLYSPPISFTDIGEPMHTLRDAGVDRELARREFLESPIYRELILGDDGQETALQVTLKPDLEWDALLERREILRSKRGQGFFSAEEKRELERVESEFATRSVIVQDQQRRYIEQVRGILERYRADASIFLGGVPMIAVDMIAFAQNDLERFGGAILGIMLLVLALIFRRAVWVLIPLTACASTCLLMLGLIAWNQWPLTVVSSNFVPLLLILSLAITIHLINYYREQFEVRPDAPHEELVLDTVRFMITPIVYTSATTGVAFASFVVSGIKPVIDFGWMMTIGIAVSMLVAFTLVPVLLLLAGKPAAKPAGSSHDPFALVMARMVVHHGNAVLLVSLLLLIVGLVGLSRLQVENRFIDYFDQSTEIYRGMELIDRELGGTIPLSIVLDIDVPSALPELPPAADEFSDDFDDEPATDSGDEFADDFDDAEASAGANPVDPWFTVYGLQRVKEVHDYLESLPEVGKVLSLGTVYDVANDLLGGGVDDIQLAIAYRSLPEDMRKLLLDPFLSRATSQAMISLRIKETSAGLRRDELLKRIRSHLVDKLGFAPDKMHMTGMLVLYNNVLQSLFRSQILTIGVTFLVILMMFLVLFRSVYLSLLALAPNLLAAGVVLGTMGLTGVPLDVMTITIAAIVVGIGVDDCIHYVFRFRHEFAIDHDYVAATYRSHGSIGKAMYYTSVTIVAGFSILALSNFRPSIYFGVLTAFAMVVAMLGGLLLLPRLILLFKPLGPDQAREAPVDAAVIAGD